MRTLRIVGISLVRIAGRAARPFALAAIAACNGAVPANQSCARHESALFPTDVLAIQATASAYLKTRRDDALSHVPADWAPLVPENAARMSTDHRFWFELRLEKGAGGWQVTRDGLVFGHAWRRP